MKGYTFIYGVDGFGNDVAPAYEEGVYLNFDKAFEHLLELNRKAIKNNSYFGNGDVLECYPLTDTAIAKAEEEEDWELFHKLIEEYRLTAEIEINQQHCVEVEQPPFNMYGLVEVEIIE